MNFKLNKIFATMLVTAMLLSIIPVFAADHNADAIWLEPDAVSFNTASTSVGDTFDVVVWTNTSTNTYTWQVRINYNSAHLNATMADYTGVGKSLFFTGLATVPVSPVLGSGYVLHGESLTGAIQKGPDYDSLFWVRFEIIAAPPKGATLNSLLDIDNVDTYWLDPVLDELTISKFGTSYEYVWSAPPNPNLAVDPAYVEYDKYTDAIGEVFDVDIIIEGLDAAWWLHNVSFSLTYNATMIDLINAVFDPLWDVSTSMIGPAGDKDFYAEASTPPSGDVVIVTLTFNVTDQCTVPPYAADDYFFTALNIEDEILFDTSIQIPTDPEVDGEVRVYCLLELSLPYLEVGDVTMGPGPSRGEHFNVTVTLKNLDWHWYMIGIEFRLNYNATLITPVAVYEGPFLPAYAPEGTWYASFFEDYPPYGPHVLYGELILPNSTGQWNPPWLGEPDVPSEGVVAIIEFEVAYQSYGEPNMTCLLEICSQLAIGLNNPDEQLIVGIPMDTPVDGEYWITTNLPGRVIDVYGGALNRGYGAHPFPAPYGGQGPDNPMDLIVPQAEVCLFANVSYNYWPTQQKLVGFEVEYPDGRILLKRTAVTDENGVAMICYEMPWPCEDPESLFGHWNVTVTVDISDYVINDTMQYTYGYMVDIFKVTTDKYEYNHCEEVIITVEFGTKSMQWYPVLLSALLMDELIVPVGIALLETEVGGSPQLCTYANFTAELTIHINKWAFAGLATIHVNAYNKDPTEGGIPWTPEFTPPPVIAIQPY
jgi:hypothetical protein